MLGLTDLEAEARTLGRERFLARYSSPALVLKTPSTSAAMPSVTTPAAVKLPSPSKGAPSKKESGPLPALPLSPPVHPNPGASDAGAIVLFVKKSERNPFANMITIGRARNNDVNLEIALVSKVHAYFTRTDEGWHLHDHGSTNGTFLNGRQLAKDEAARLVDGSEIQLAPEVVLIFYTPEGLYRVLTGA